MPQTFDCPKCGAPVNYERSLDPGNTKSTVRCDYCHSQLIAPNELTGQPPQVVRIQLGVRNPAFILVMVGVIARDHVIKYAVQPQ